MFLSSRLIRSRSTFVQVQSPYSRQYTTPLSSLNKASIAITKAKDMATKIEKATTIKDSDVQKAFKGKANPFSLVENDLAILNKNIKKHIRTDFALLANVAQYYFDLTGKRIRPVVMLLLSRALSRHLHPNQVSEVSWKQTQLAEIIEMIHTASLIHDDVLDDATTRRNMPSANVAYGNKVSILVGDYLLARASIALSELENFEVTRLMSVVISDLVEGELLQLDCTNFDSYIQKTYYKTASLIANGCRATCVLGNNELMPREYVELATTYGNGFGLAFQLYDDVLDFVGTAEALGKPVGNDLKLGIITAPALYAAEEFPELATILQRKLSKEGDLEKAYDYIRKSKGIDRTKELAREHINKARKALEGLVDSEEKMALMDIAELVINRDK